MDWMAIVSLFMNTKILKPSILLLILLFTGCATLKISVKRMAPAKFDITGINKVGIMNYGSEQSSYEAFAKVLTSTIETKLIAQNFFHSVTRINRTSGPVIMPQHIADIGKEERVDLVIFGVVESYGSSTRHDTKKVEEEVHTGIYRTEYYVDNGVQRSRQVEIIEKKIKHVPTAERRAALSFKSYALRPIDEKYVGKDLLQDSRRVRAEGDSDIRSMPSEQSMLNDLTARLTDIFITHVTPHEVTEVIKLKGNGKCKDGMKLAKAGDWEGAMDSWQNILNSNPNDDLANYDLGVANEYFKNYEQAREYYREAMRISNKSLYNEAWVRVHDIIQQNEKLKKQMQGH